MQKQIDIQWLSAGFRDIITATLVRSFIVLMTVVLLVGCSTKHSGDLAFAQTNSITLGLVSASNFLLELHKESRLPGDSKDEHGELMSENVPFSGSVPTEAVYPLVRTFYMVKTGDTFTNHYTVGRQSKDSEWILQRAWRTDSQGRTIEDWPVQ